MVTPVKIIISAGKKKTAVEHGPLFRWVMEKLPDSELGINMSRESYSFSVTPFGSREINGD